jgi:hypothetical protein
VRKRNRERKKKKRGIKMREAAGEKIEKERDGSDQSDPVFSETLPTGHNPNSNPFNKPNPKPI